VKRTHPAEYSEILQIALIFFSAVSLGTLEFLKHAFPAPWVVLPDKTTVVLTVLIVQVAPALVLVALDRLIAARDVSGRWLRLFRTIVFSVALLLILRQLEVYWGPGQDIAHQVRSVSNPLMVALGIACLAAIVALTTFAHRGVTQFFYYMAPVAIATSAIIPFQIPTGDAASPESVREANTVEDKFLRDPVFVLVFDGLAYDGLVGESGRLNQESFPNFAALANDGIWFTNATSNHFWTNEAVPSIARPLTQLTDSFNLRLYSQFLQVEDSYQDGCGQKYTCRGVRYLTSRNRLFIAAEAALSTYDNLTPDFFDKVTRWPMGLVVNAMGVPFPSTDRLGFQLFTKKHFNAFLGDVGVKKAAGRAYLFHVTLPHHPYVFRPNGDASFSRLGDNARDESKVQTGFADLLVGRFIERLKEEGLYERSTVIVTSDHGYRHDTSPGDDYIPLHEAAHVPLIIHAPGLESAVSDVDYQHIDVGPTLVDILDLPPIDGSVGVSAFAAGRAVRDKLFYVGDRPFRYDPATGEWEAVDPKMAALGGASVPTPTP